MDKKMIYAVLAILAMFTTACGGEQKDNAGKDSNQPLEETGAEIVDANGNISYRPDTAKVYYDGKINLDDAFIVISKKNLQLSVYADLNGDTTLIARYPVCMSRNKGQKEKSK